MLGLGTSIIRGNIHGVEDLGIIKDNLVLDHSNYGADAVRQVGTGAADINSDADANEYIDVGAITIGTGDVSVSAWVYVTNFVDYGGIFTNRQDASTHPGISIRTRNSLKIEAVIDDGESDTASILTTALSINQWYHVCVVWDRSHKQFLYINGVLKDSDTITDEALTLNHSDSAMIGRNNKLGTSYDFRGYICNVGYWNRTLSQAEVKSIMWKNYAYLTATEKNLLAGWWNLDSTAAATSVDTSGAKHVLDNNLSLGSNLYEYANNDPVQLEKIDEQGNNTIEINDNAVKVTFVNNDDGARFKFSRLKLLTSNLTNGAFYQLKFTVKINTGTANLRLNLNGDQYIVATISHTYYVEYTTFFQANHATNNRLDMENMDGVEAIWVKDISVKLVTGNIGTLA